MLVGINHLIGAPVMSLQTGQPLARLDSPIINPRNLRIVAFYVSGPKVDFKPAVVFTDDIREFGEIGAIVDSSDNILSPEGMVRLLEVINYNFLLTGLPVSDDHHQKIGKVDSFTVDPVNFMIRQLYVKPTLLQRFLVANVVINRQQIIKIEPKRIIVKAPTVQQKQASPGSEGSHFLDPKLDNPFRKKPTPSPNQARSNDN